MLELEDLMGFFGAEPVLDKTDVEWPYAGASFRYTGPQDSVWCWLAPGEGDFALVWRQGDTKRLELSLTGYFKVQLEYQSGVRRLVAIPQSEDRPPLVLQLTPHVFVALGAV